MKLNAKFSILLICTAIIPTVVIMGVTLPMHNEQLHTSNLESTQNRVTQAANAITKELSAAVHEVELYAQLPELTSMDPVRFLPFLISELYRQEGRYEKFIVGNLDGTFSNTSGGNPAQKWLRTTDDNDAGATPLNIRKRDYWQITAGQNHRNAIAVVSEPMISYTTGVKQIVVASSILDDESVVIGMVGAGIQWERMQALINEVKERHFGDLDWEPQLFLATKNGNYWYHWDPKKVVQLKRDSAGSLVLNEDNQTISITHSITDEPYKGFSEQFEVMRAGKHGHLSFTDDQTNIEKMLIHAPIGVADYTLGIVVDDAELTRSINKLIGLYISFLLGFFVIVIALALLLSRQVTIPLTELIQTVRHYASGNYRARVASKAKDEIADLGNTFNEMAVSIEEREIALRQSEERFDLAMQGANDGLWDWNVAENSIYYSQRWKEMLGYEEEDVKDVVNSLYQLLHPDDRNKVRQAITAVLEGETTEYQHKYRMRCKDGSYQHILSRAFPVVENNTVTRLVGTHVDITEQVYLEQTILKSNRELEQRVEERTQALKEAYAELEKISLQDSLLQIGNRRAMERDLDMIATVSLRYKTPYAIALIDVDWFKRYNDRYGHIEGDAALQSVANAICNNLRDSDRLYRYGGEELLLLMPNTNLQDAMTCAERMRVAVSELELIHEDSPKAVVTISLGVTASNQRPWQALLKTADEALYSAKEAGRNNSIAA